jgi:NAD(P)-dependent dehydrogenase (short-subunit alcohol dehydrogenase family)
MSGYFDLAGKIIIVTGAGSGIGQGIARGLRPRAWI